MKPFALLIGGFLILCTLLSGSSEAVVTDEECLECHSDRDLKGTTKTGKEIPVFVDRAIFKESVHADVGCVSCHADVKEIPHDEALAPVNCGECHADIAEEYQGGIHGQAVAGGNQNAPSCASCHGSHDIRGTKDPLSSVFVTHLPETCARCHSDSSVVPQKEKAFKTPYRLYKHGVHGIALSKGVTNVASCNNCHGSHRLKSANDPTSPIFRKNIPSTCSKCHNEVYQKYEIGIHGQAVTAGNRDAPICIDCHGEHEIISPSDPASPVSPRNISTTCSACHEDVRLTKRYGIPARRLTTYMDTYHGLANKAGVPVVANCASCHGAHDILPSSDPRSSINKANIPTTCGKCHPNAGANFAKGSVHLTTVEESGKIVDYIKQFYVLLIVVTIGGMCLHNGLDFLRRLRHDYRQRKSPQVERWEEEEGKGRLYLRWTLGERIQHWIMAISFITLVITGFALKYQEVFWVAPLIKNGQTMDWRGIVHRVAAVIFIALAVYHVGYILFTRRGREQCNALMWRKRDLREIRQMLMINTGLGKEPPEFDRFNYIEKSEYWALIWGGIVMGITGLLLWFENTALTYFPKWLLDVATAVHLYEAWLATLAIIVWHFYAVIFNPQVYPLNWSMITGWLTEEEMAEEHPDEYRRLRDSDRR